MAYLTVILGVLNVYQFVNWWIERRMRTTYDRNVSAAIDSLAAMRAMCTEATNDPTKVDTAEKGKAFASSVAYMAVSIENTLAAILPDKKA
jgi:hypothetical protein